MSSLVTVAANAALANTNKKQKRQNKNNVRRKPGKKNQNKNKQYSKRKSAGHRKGQNAKTSIINSIVAKELGLRDAQHLYNRALNNAFDVRMPPLDHQRDMIEPIDASGTYNFTASSSIPISQYMLFRISPAAKALWNIATVATSNSVFSAAVPVDSLNLTSLTTNFAEARFGVGAIAVKVDVIATVLRPTLYIGQLPTATEASSTWTPDTLIASGIMRRIETDFAYVGWSPVDLATMAFTTSVLTTGGTSDANPAVLVYGADTTATTTRIAVDVVMQGEGLPKVLVSGVFGQMPNSSVKYTLGEIFETASSFTWKTVDAVKHIDPTVLSTVGAWASQYLEYRNGNVARGQPRHRAITEAHLSMPGPAPVAPRATVVLLDGRTIVWTRQEVDNILSDARMTAYVRRVLSPDVFEQLVSFSTVDILVSQPSSISFSNTSPSLSVSLKPRY